MAIKLVPSLTKSGDTIANHGTQTSGNAVSVSVPSVRTVKEPIDITDVSKDIHAVHIGRSTADAETLAEVVASTLKSFELIKFQPIGLLPSPPSVTADVRVLIDQETDKLDVLSDSIGSALLSVLNVHGPLSSSQMTESLDITTEVLISHIEILQRTRLVTRMQTLEGICYSISEEGIEFLRSLGLEEENRQTR